MTQLNHESHNQIYELNNLYQEVIVDHFKRPRYKERLTDCRFCQEGKNPICGDVISVFCKVVDQNDSHSLCVTFDGSGCAISQASASIMCDMLQKKSLKEAKIAINYAEKIYTGQTQVNPDDLLDDIEALSGIRQFPARVKCAALPWKTLQCLIEENFDENNKPIASSCKKHIAPYKQQKKLRIVTTES